MFTPWLNTRVLDLVNTWFNIEFLHPSPTKEPFFHQKNEVLKMEVLTYISCMDTAYVS